MDQTTTVPVLAPIAIFAYRRVLQLASCLDALERCPEFSSSPVFIFSDGPRDEEAAPDVAAVRALLRSRQQANVTLVEASENRGLATSIISGVSYLCEQYGKVIVVEDDLIVRPATLRWLNDCLSAYEDDPRVMHVNAYQFRAPELKGFKEGIFITFPGSWGWATWKRAWNEFDESGQGWEQLVADPQVARSFNVDGAYPLSRYMINQMTGKSDSWAIRWCWSIFNARGLVIAPPRSLVENVGFDVAATHNNLGVLKRFLPRPTPFLWNDTYPPKLPQTVGLNASVMRIFRRALIRTGSMRNERIKAALRSLGLWRRS